MFVSIVQGLSPFSSKHCWFSSSKGHGLLGPHSAFLFTRFVGTSWRLQIRRSKPRRSTTHGGARKYTHLQFLTAVRVKIWSPQEKKREKEGNKASRKQEERKKEDTRVASFIFNLSAVVTPSIFIATENQLSSLTTILILNRYTSDHTLSTSEFVLFAYSAVVSIDHEERALVSKPSS
jgi:hypothetical protein